VLLSPATADLVREALPAGASLHDTGPHWLRGLVRAEPVYQLLHPELPASVPPLRSLEMPAGAHTIEVRNTSFPAYTKRIDVRSGKPVRISHRFR
jgi:hypothetical protein